MLFDIIRTITFRNQLLLLQKSGARVGLDLSFEKLSRVTIKSVGLFTVTVTYDDLDLELLDPTDFLDDWDEDEEWTMYKENQEECVLYEDTILISDILLITNRILETTNIEEKKQKLNKLL